MMESMAPLSSFGVVPDVGDFDFDLGTLDTFDDMDIDMESFNMLDDQCASADPFGSLSFEASLNLAELQGLAPRGAQPGGSILDDFDVKEPIKQDCMWSAFQDAAGKNRSVYIKRQRAGRGDAGHGSSLTPPSSYINDHLRVFDTPLPSSDDDESSSGEELDVVSPTSATCPRLVHQAGDHCYTSASSPAPWSNNTSAAAPLTPPESSEDEDSSQGRLLPPPGSPDGHTGKKAGLSEIENDRFNKVVKNILLKNSGKTRPGLVTDASSGKAKFRFCLTTKNKSSLLAKQRGSHTYRRLNSIKENKQMKKAAKLSPSPTSVRQKNRLEQEEVKDHREARDVHNQMERQRRNDLKNAFDSLKDFVPTIATSDRASKQTVLNKATDYCKNLKSKEFNTREQRKTLVQKNESLRKRLALLESQMTSCQLENVAWEIQGW